MLSMKGAAGQQVQMLTWLSTTVHLKADAEGIELGLHVSVHEHIV